MKPETAFKYLNENKNENKNETNSIFGIFSKRKNGQLYKRPSATCKTEDIAKETVIRMTKLNPGKEFTFKKL